MSSTPINTGAAGIRPGRTMLLPQALRRNVHIVGLLPFFAYVAVFFGAPSVLVAVKAFQDEAGTWTVDNMLAAVQDVYFDSFVESIKLATASALSGTIIGFVCAYAVLRTGNPWLRRLAQTASGVFANTGGIPLAFMFIASLGTYGLVTRALQGVGLDIYSGHWTLFGFSGLLLVYLYFQIPLMMIVILPALDAQKPTWREAAKNLGASTTQYWLHVGGPILFAPTMGAFLLLFTNAFAAYATARALTAGTIPLVPLQIGSLLAGNVIADRANLGFALGLGMILVVAVAMTVYQWTQRRTAQWLAS